MIRLSLVIPTYNERDNVVELLERLADVLADTPHEILVVDDDSPDRTWEAARGRKDVTVVRRQGARGLGSAIVHGFEKARGELLGVIDADLQHDESILPDMIDAARDAELVVASRYTRDGGLGDWTWWRRAQSRVARRLAQLVLDAGLTDPLSGFFLLRRELFERVAPRLDARGQKLLLEIYAHAAPVRTAEVGYVFRPRRRGASKRDARVMIDYVKSLNALRHVRAP